MTALPPHQQQKPPPSRALRFFKISLLFIILSAVALVALFYISPSWRPNWLVDAKMPSFAPLQQGDNSDASPNTLETKLKNLLKQRHHQHTQREYPTLKSNPAVKLPDYFTYSIGETKRFLKEKLPFLATESHRVTQFYTDVPKKFHHRMRLHTAPPQEDAIYLVHFSSSDSATKSTLHSLAKKSRLPVMGRNLVLMPASEMNLQCTSSTHVQCSIMEWTLQDQTAAAPFLANHLTAQSNQEEYPKPPSLKNSIYHVNYLKMTPQLEKFIQENHLYTTIIGGANTIVVDYYNRESSSPHILTSLLQFNTTVYQVHQSLKRFNSMHNYAANQVIQHKLTEHSKPSSTNRTYIWQKGVRGKTQIAAISDTGIDYDNCFFANSLKDSSMRPNTFMDAHRKIYYYQRMKLTDGSAVYESDAKDEISGHGTHTSGSLAGSIIVNHTNYNDLHIHNGVAPDARLYFQDIHSPQHPFLLIPSPLNLLFQPAYAAKARVHSNSWGCDYRSQFSCQMDCKCVWNSGNSQGEPAGTEISDSYCMNWVGRRCCSLCSVYDDQSVDVDNFLNNNDEMTIFFAAGNMGTTSLTGNVVTPGTSKNAVTVGASMSLNEGFVRSVNKTDFKSVFEQLNAITGGVLNFKTTDDCCAYTGNQESLIHELCCPRVIRALYQSNPAVYSNDNLAPFSGRGPIPSDGRYGVDVIAPGMPVISMHSDGDTRTQNCGTMPPALGNKAAVMESQGTSMSTPLVAGAGVLVRDYYQSGYYPRGVAHNSQKFPDLSGMLVKATILHSAQPISGKMYLGSGHVYSLSQSFPNGEVGFGQVELASALKFDDSNFNLFVVNRREIKEGDRQSFCFSYNAQSDVTNAEFRATLVWYDVEGGSEAATGVALVNDLELNAWKLKNNGEDFSLENAELTYYPGNNNPYHDQVNTAEQIRISMEDISLNDKFIVTVEGISQVALQNYALVITHSKHLSMTEGCTAPERPSAPLDFRAILFVAVVVGGLLLLLAVSTTLVVALVYGIVKGIKSAPSEDDGEVARVSSIRQRIASLFSRRARENNGSVELQDEDEASVLGEDAF